MLKTGDILNTHNTFVWWKPWRYLSLAIRVFQRIRYGKFAWVGHTAIAVRVKDTIWVYEADPKVMVTEYSKWAKDKKVSVTRLPVEMWIGHGVNPTDIYLDCEKELGTKYDYLGLLFYQPIFILTGLWIGPKKDKRVYCSEFVARILDKNFKLFPNTYEINPAKIWEATRGPENAGSELCEHEIFRGWAKDIRK